MATPSPIRTYAPLTLTATSTYTTSEAQFHITSRLTSTVTIPYGTPPISQTVKTIIWNLGTEIDGNFTYTTEYVYITTPTSPPTTLVTEASTSSDAATAQTSTGDPTGSAGGDGNKPLVVGITVGISSVLVIGMVVLWWYRRHVNRTHARPRPAVRPLVGGPVMRGLEIEDHKRPPDRIRSPLLPEKSATPVAAPAPKAEEERVEEDAYGRCSNVMSISDTGTTWSGMMRAGAGSGQTHPGAPVGSDLQPLVSPSEVQSSTLVDSNHSYQDSYVSYNSRGSSAWLARSSGTRSGGAFDLEILPSSRYNPNEARRSPVHEPGGEMLPQTTYDPNERRRLQGQQQREESGGWSNVVQQQNLLSFNNSAQGRRMDVESGLSYQQNVLDGDNESIDLRELAMHAERETERNIALARLNGAEIYQRTSSNIGHFWDRLSGVPRHRDRD
jgi:hypothetical protein